MKTPFEQLISDLSRPLTAGPALFKARHALDTGQLEGEEKVALVKAVAEARPLTWPGGRCAKLRG